MGEGVRGGDGGGTGPGCAAIPVLDGPAGATLPVARVSVIEKQSLNTQYVCVCVCVCGLSMHLRVYECRGGGSAKKYVPNPRQMSKLNGKNASLIHWGSQGMLKQCTDG